MKTAISILQELMVKKNQAPQFECIYQGGPPHQMIFKYKCLADGVSVTATARSKKDAKQEVARLCLEEFAKRGLYTPEQGIKPPPPPPTAATAGATSTVVPQPYSYVALLKELCEQYHLPTAEYVLVSDTGPAHLREFAQQVSVGDHTRLARASTKKQARQLAAQQLYSYLKEHLAHIIQEFNEEEALIHASEKAMNKYKEIKEEPVPWRPNLGQKISEYHLGMKTYVEKEKRVKALDLIENTLSTDNLVDKVEEVLREMGLEFEWRTLATSEKYMTIVLLHVPRSYPAITVASPPDVEARAKHNTAREAIQVLKTLLT